MCLDEVLEIVASDFLLALSNYHHVHGQPATRLEMRFERFYMEEQLAFVIDRAASINISVADGLLEWRGGPQLERLRRLHVIVPIDQQCRRAGCISPLADNDWVSRRRMNCRLESRILERFLQPFCCPRNIG